MQSIINEIQELNKKRDKILEDYDRSLESIFNSYKPPKEVDELGNQIREILIVEQENLPVDFIIESLTKLGECPSILYDDNGHFAVTSDGFQSVPRDDDGELLELPTDDVSMAFYVEKKQWFPTIREALIFYLSE